MTPMRALSPQGLPGGGQKERDELLSLGRMRRFRAGELLLSPVDLPGQAALIIDGLVKLTGLAADGHETLLYIRGRGDLLNEEAAFRGRPPEARGPGLSILAAALTDGAARVFPVRRLREFFDNHPAQLLAAAQKLCERLEDAETRIASMGHENADKRLARLLCELERYGTPFRKDPVFGAYLRPEEKQYSITGTEIPFPLTHSELAAWVGACRETVDRALRRWRARGIIYTSYRSIVILDLQRLAHIAGIRVSRATWSPPPVSSTGSRGAA